MKRKSGHIVGDVGETSTSLIFKQWGWTSDKIVSDYGEDLDCHVFINNLKTHYHFRCQVKSTLKNENFIRKLKCGDFSVNVKIEIVKSWLLAYYPVFLIVFDESLKNHYWINANKYIQQNLNRLNRKSFSFRIPATNILPESKENVLSEIRNFYENIFRLDSSELETNIYPIIMPIYLSISLEHFKNLPKKDHFQIEPEVKNISKLPSWFLDIETLNPPNIFCIKARSKEKNIEKFIDQVISSVNEWEIKIKENQWLSFVIAPIQMKSSSDTQSVNEFWNKEITSWFCISKIADRIFQDDQYAFQPPKGFYSQVGRRATSYETFHHINPKDDIAIELFSSIKTPLSYKYETNKLFEQINSQFIPWKTKIGEEQILINQLPDDLTFSKVEAVDNISGYTRGIISRTIFNPTVGLFNAILNWDDLYNNNIRNKIRQLYSEQKIVGEEDEDKTSKIIHSYFDNFNDVGEQISISQKDKINGYPLDLSRRMIFVQRYRRLKNPDLDTIDEKLGVALDSLKNNKSMFELYIGCQEVDEYTSEIKIYRIYFHWRPKLEDLSTESYEKIRESIIKIFDEIFPQEENTDEDNNTYSILRFCGLLYFEEI